MAKVFEIYADGTKYFSFRPFFVDKRPKTVASGKARMTF